MKRREFLKLTAGSAPFLSLPGILSKCTASEENIFTATVAAVRGTSLSGMTINLLNMLGGIQNIVQSGETVFIKPNMVSLPWGNSYNCCSYGECTKPEILVALAENCLQAGAAEVIIGDGSQAFTFDWSKAVYLDGSTNLEQQVQVLNSTYAGKTTLACLETASPGWAELPTSTSLNTIAVSNLVTQADKLISVPVAKTHSWAQLSLGMKNFLGITSLARYAHWYETFWNRDLMDHSTPAAIAQIYLDIVAALKPDLTIVDFSIGLEANGPLVAYGGKTVDMKARLGSWLLLGSTDIVAADATSARIMSHDVGQMVQLNLAYNMGLGEKREDHIKILGENLADLIVPWQAAELLKAEPKCPSITSICPG